MTFPMAPEGKSGPKQNVACRIEFDVYQELNRLAFKGTQEGVCEYHTVSDILRDAIYHHIFELRKLVGGSEEIPSPARAIRRISDRNKRQLFAKEFEETMGDLQVVVAGYMKLGDVEAAREEVHKALEDIDSMPDCVYKDMAYERLIKDHAYLIKPEPIVE